MNLKNSFETLAKTLIVPFCCYSNPVDSTSQKEAEEKNQTTPSSTKSSQQEDQDKRSTNGSSLQVKIFHEIGKPIQSSLHKISVVGTGAVGMACAFSILTRASIYVKITSKLIQQNQTPNGLAFYILRKTHIA